jgi:hypothetical protein
MRLPSGDLRDQALVGHSDLVLQRDARFGMLVVPGEPRGGASCATAGGRQDARWDHLGRPSRQVQAVAARLNADGWTLIEQGDRWERAGMAPDGAQPRARRPVDAVRIEGLLSCGEAGDGGLGEDPVGDADARVGGL